MAERENINKVKNTIRADLVFVVILFVILTILTTLTVANARAAKNEAQRVAKQLDSTNITAQNRCVIQVVLSYPPPVTQDQFDVVLNQYDECIKKETGKETNK